MPFRSDGGCSWRHGDSDRGYEDAALGWLFVRRALQRGGHVAHGVRLGRLLRGQWNCGLPPFWAISGGCGQRALCFLFGWERKEVLQEAAPVAEMLGRTRCPRGWSASN